MAERRLRGTVVNTDTFRCAACGGTFDKEWTEAEAVTEPLTHVWMLTLTLDYTEHRLIFRDRELAKHHALGMIYDWRKGRPQRWRDDTWRETEDESSLSIYERISNGVSCGRVLVCRYPVN